MPMNEDAEAIAYLTAERDKLARDLAVCKIARDGWIKASDEAHARIRELEAAISEHNRLCTASGSGHWAIALTANREGEHG